MTVFLRLIEEPVQTKSDLLKRIVRERSGDVFEIDARVFESIPGTPFAYWVEPEIVQIFSACEALNSSDRVVVSTNPLNLDERYVRLWFEVSPASLNARWMPWAKGGEYAKLYCDIYTVISWDQEQSTYHGFVGTVNRPMSRPASMQYFFRPGITWPRRTNGLSFRVLPKGAIFADKGPAAFIDGDDPRKILATCAVMNSDVFGHLVAIQLARTELAQSYEVGLVQRTPFPQLNEGDVDILSDLAEQLWLSKYRAFSKREIGHGFVVPERSSGCVSSFVDASRNEAELFARLEQICLRSYGLEEGVRAGSQLSGSKSVDALGSVVTQDQDVGEEIEEPSFGESLGLLSWSIGVAFARFDIRLATGERAIPPEPQPFDPLPAKSPGMLPDGDAPFMPTSGVFVDDPGHVDDLGARVTAIYERIDEASPAPGELRRTLARDFFPAHIRLYSRSRRKAPIYWQLATPSASYSVWLYIHAFNSDTLFRVLNDYVTPKLAHERRELEGLLAEGSATPTSAQSRAIAAQSGFVEELSALQDEVKRVAPLWGPDLDDGVMINFAPLWRLTPQNRAWQKELRDTWAALCEGKYEWARLTMRLWPERVVPKCATDRSLAIAHDLEDVFWYQDPDGKWQARPVPTQPIARLIAERTSATVKAALSSLNEAPTPATGVRRGGRKSN